MHRESPCFPRLGGEEKPTYSEFFVKPARARAKKEKKRGATIKHEELEESKIQSSVSITDSATHVFPFPDHHFPFLYLPPGKTSGDFQGASVNNDFQNSGTKCTNMPSVEYSSSWNLYRDAAITP
jgi:hypothetical protein